MANRILAMALFGALLSGCSGDGSAGRDADEEAICEPYRLRCDPEGTNMLQRCSDDGASWDDFMQCDLCHDAQCYGRLDASSG